MRRAFDFYETPPHYLAALLGEVAVFGRVFEPCVGDGAIASRLRELPSVRRVLTNDLDPQRAADTHADARHAQAWPTNLDWVVTNPPFADEVAILEQALEAAPNVAMLARLSFLEPAEDRSGLLEAQPPHRIIVLPRYSFRLNDAGKRQTDNVTCAWVVWGAAVERGVAVWGRSKATAMAVLKGWTV